MKKLANFIAARTWVVIVVPILILTVVLSAATTDAGNGNTIVVIVFVVVAALTLLTLGLNLAGFDPRSSELAEQLAPTGVRRQLVERWLRRSRYYRYIGAAVGCILGAAFVTNGELTPVLFGLLGGIAVGGALAELHILRRKSGGARTADLTARRVADYTNRLDTAVMALAVAGSVIVGLIAALGVADGGRRSMVLALGAAIVVALTSGLQRLVVTRPRPAVSTELREADDLLRHLAATQGFARPAIAVALLQLGYAVAALSDGGRFNLLAFAIAVVGIVWYVRSRQPAIEHLVAGAKA